MTGSRRVAWVVAATVVLPPGSASADHDFHTMGRLTPTSTAGAGIAYEVWREGSDIDRGVAVDLWAHYVAGSGLGGYLTVPASYLRASTPTDFAIEDGTSSTTLGNLELGVLYAADLGKRHDLVFHLGIALPTMGEDPQYLNARYTALPRWRDLVLRLDDGGYWLRLGVAPSGQIGRYFWRADVGVDVGIGPVVHVDAAVGVELGRAEITAELVNSLVVDELDHTIAFGSRIDAGRVEPGLALVLPLGHSDGAEDVAFAIALSVTARLP